MPSLTRREALAGLAAAAASGLPRSSGAATAKSEFLSTDIGALEKVLVHSLSRHDDVLGQEDEGILPVVETDMLAAERQHAALMELLRKSGAELIEIRDALAGAIEVTRSTGVLETWVRTTHPRLPWDPKRITADVLLGRDESTHYVLGPEGDARLLVSDSVSTIWTRDSAFMSPQGLVICNAASRRRHRENVLLRFLYRHSPMLDAFPVVFDAVQEGLIIEGGDATVVDERTLFLGTGNRTDPRIAPILARRLDMDVLTVQTVAKDHMRRGPWSSSGKASALRALVLHLDTFFTLVGPKHALCVPMLLEKEHAEDNPLAQFIRGARSETKMPTDEAKAALTILKGLGTVRMFRRGSGREEDLGGIKLVDYLRSQDYRFTFTGGELPDGDQDRYRHFMEVTYPEQRRQASNVVQATPGRVIAYSGNPETEKALKASGIEVDTFPGRELWAWHGGPHCLTQPLVRSRP
ncbi:MAG: arginine deiminase family protein [Myxococcota bacterium]